MVPLSVSSIAEMDSKLIIPCDSGIQPYTDMQQMLIEDFSVSDTVLGIVTKGGQALSSGRPCAWAHGSEEIIPHRSLYGTALGPRAEQPGVAAILKVVIHVGSASTEAE